jgi:hypothetical protein
MAFTMAFPNFKKGLKMAFGPFGVKKNVFTLALVFSKLALFFFKEISGSAKSCYSVIKFKGMIGMPERIIQYTTRMCLKII